MTSHHGALAKHFSANYNGRNKVISFKFISLKINHGLFFSGRVQIYSDSILGLALLWSTQNCRIGSFFLSVDLKLGGLQTKVPQEKEKHQKINILFENGYKHSQQDRSKLNFNSTFIRLYTPWPRGLIPETQQ